MAGEKLLDVPMHEGHIGECAIQYGLSQPTDRCLASAVHRQSPPDALPAPLARHTHVDDSAVLPLPSEVDARQARRRNDRVVERQPR